MSAGLNWYIQQMLSHCEIMKQMGEGDTVMGEEWSKAAALVESRRQVIVEGQFRC